MGWNGMVDGYGFAGIMGGSVNAVDPWLVRYMYGRLLPFHLLDFFFPLLSLCVDENVDCCLLSLHV